MQLKHRVGLRPLTITSLLVANSLTAFAYSDIDQYSHVNANVTNNNLTSNYIKEFQSTSYTGILLKIHFEELLTNWQKKTKYCSSVQQIIRNKEFQSIVEMGDSVVPLIVNEIDQRPSLLVWALNLIYNKKITNYPNATIEEACRLWVKKLNA